MNAFAIRGGGRVTSRIDLARNGEIRGLDAYNEWRDQGFGCMQWRRSARVADACSRQLLIWCCGTEDPTDTRTLLLYMLLLMQVNTSVYVTGLPLDVTEAEVAALFSKCGLIKVDEKGQPRVKLYKCVHICHWGFTQSSEALEHWSSFSIEKEWNQSFCNTEMQMNQQSLHVSATLTSTGV